MIFAIYKCLDCGVTFVADSMHWRMYYCPKCKKNGVDLEEYGCRYVGHIEHIETFKPPFFEDEEEYQSALLTFLNSADEEYTIYKLGKTLIIEKIG